MSRETKDLTQLARLTEAEFQSRQARMARLARRADAIRAKLAEIETDRRAQLAALTAEDAFVRSGAVVDWQAWVDGRKGTLNRELARVLAEMERAKPALAHSFGRDRAIRDLIERKAAEARLRASRRA